MKFSFKFFPVFKSPQRGGGMARIYIPEKLSINNCVDRLLSHSYKLITKTSKIHLIYTNCTTSLANLNATIFHPSRDEAKKIHGNACWICCWWCSSHESICSSELSMNLTNWAHKLITSTWRNSSVSSALSSEIAGSNYNLHPSLKVPVKAPCIPSDGNYSRTQ